MRLSLTTLVASLMVFAAQAARAAPPPAAASVANLPSMIKPLLVPANGMGNVGGWPDLDKVKGVTWAPGPTMQDKPTPDGSYFVRPGRGVMDGRPLDVLATGARAGVFYVYIRDPGASANADATSAEFKQAGYAVSLARCPVNPLAANGRRWLKLTAPGKAPVFLQVGPLVSGGAGYVLFIADQQLAPLTGKDATLYTDNCAGR